MQFGVSNFQKYVQTVKILLNLTRIASTLPLYVCNSIAPNFSWNVSSKSCGEKKIVPFRSMEKYMVQPDRPQITIKYGSLRLEIHTQKM